jgi:hypothetical protein
MPPCSIKESIEKNLIHGCLTFLSLTVTEYWSNGVLLKDNYLSSIAPTLHHSITPKKVDIQGNLVDAPSYRLSV